MNQAPSMLKPALISGAAFGVAGAIPYLNIINCFCCALFVCAGLCAAFLYSKECQTAEVPFRAGGGATIGLLAGLISGAVTSVSAAIISRMIGSGDWEQAMEGIQAAGSDVPPEYFDLMVGFMEAIGPTGFLLIGIFIHLVGGTIFGTIGGLIGGSVFKVQERAPQNEQAPPPPPIA